VSIDQRAFRDSLGLFATGVCLVSLVDSDGEAHALTVNSFASVSLDPPLVLWSLQKDSDIYHLYASAPRFGIAMLSAEQDLLSSAYATKGGHRLDSAHYDSGTNGAPVIKDALVNFECSLEQALDGGDHTVLLCRVTRLVPGDDAQPLLFYSGQYRGLL
jgi:flavin reductase (DIM6/NTAB) family NADH-FMN oxidoreductase RutF